MNKFKHLENKIVYFYKVHASFFESSLEWIKKPLKDRTLKIKSIIDVEENFYMMTFFNNTTTPEFYYNEKYNYFISEIVKDHEMSSGYLIIADNRISIYKSIFNIIQHKRKGSKAIYTSLGDQNCITREFYTFKQKLSHTKYFEIYPEDFL